MAIVLEIDTTKSLFEPIEVKIDGELFRVKEITLGALEKIQRLQKDTAEGSAAAIRQQLEALMDGDHKVLGRLTMSQLEQVLGIVIEKSLKPRGPEKNEPTPGEPRLPS